MGCSWGESVVEKVEFKIWKFYNRLIKSLDPLVQRKSLTNGTYCPFSNILPVMMLVTRKDQCKLLTDNFVLLCDTDRMRHRMRQQTTHLIIHRTLQRILMFQKTVLRQRILLRQRMLLPQRTDMR